MIVGQVPFIIHHPKMLSENIDYSGAAFITARAWHTTSANIRTLLQELTGLLENVTITAFISLWTNLMFEAIGPGGKIKWQLLLILIKAEYKTST
jgi:hypothetical protein